jgi:hypothetical protein
MESEHNVHNKKLTGIVDLLFFDRASNVQNAGKILRAFNPCITVGHGAEHVVSLFFLRLQQGSGLQETLQLRQEDPQYIWFGKAQPLGNVQKV